MTIVYFVRHAEPNYTNHDDQSRELTAKGIQDRTLVTKFLSVKEFTVAFSSPYKRAIDTIQEFTDIQNLKITTLHDLRERRIDSDWIPDFNAFSKKQWEDFKYKLSDGECLLEVQNRNISALLSILRQYKDKNIVIGTHGTALSTIINYYDSTFGYSDFVRIKSLMPWIVRMSFDGEKCIDIEQYDLFQ
ncbi:MAG: histidine phosphatase family protein [Ruminococcus sp.]|nr:histidine phosphatase family protein [Ruminococcus sp.]